MRMSPGQAGKAIGTNNLDDFIDTGVKIDITVDNPIGSVAHLKGRLSSWSGDRG